MVRQLPAHMCHGVVTLRNRGMKQRAIARVFNISQGEVSKILRRRAETGVPTPRPRPGRPLKTTRRDDRLLIRLCRGGRTKSASALRTEWQNAINVPISRELVNKRLIKAGYRARRPLWKPLLKPRHRQQRVQWARGHLRWGAQHWRHVVFSDEARFLVYRHDGRLRVRRRVEEKYHEDTIAPRVQAGGGGITVWAAFHAGGKTDLVVLDGNLDHRKYLRILNETLMPFARGFFRNNFVFQDDNAPAHRARAVTAFWENNDVEHMEWPACSPDMNPLENLWAEVTRNINSMDHQPTTVEECRQAVVDAWAAIPDDLLRTLSDSMPHRVEALRAARGDVTKY